MSMESCDNGHQEIVFNSGGMMSGFKSCPVCEANERITELEKEVEELEERLED